MENHVKKLYHRLPMFLVGLVVWSSLFVSCKDDYPYDDGEPPWLGESIYEYLAADGNYKNFVKIIDDLGYSEVLRKTGSKTLFVADDDAFQRFYNSNKWGASQYSDLTESQKKLILNFSVINNAYLIETLSNYYDNGLQEGSALRRSTTVTYLDSVPFVLDNKLPETDQWKKYKSDSKNGLYLLQDGSAYPLVHLLQKSLDYYGITDPDFKIMTGIDRVRNDAHIFSHKVIDRDITCKNGYIHKLDDVLTLPTSMAAYIRNVPSLSLFSNMLDWFSAPYYDAEKTRQYRAYLADRDIPFTDSVFVLGYFNSSKNNGARTSYPSGSSVPTTSLLAFSPGFNNLINKSGALQSDMASIFAPTNQALEDYLTGGQGRALFDRYGTWDNILPNETDNEELKTFKMKILAKLINRHLRESLVISVPSLFYKMVDNTSSLLRTDRSDIVDSLNYIGLNGLVYATNKVYPPDDFISVYGPVFFSNKTYVLNWAINEYKYNLYLNSMVNKYAFVAPTDKALEFYIDPFSYGTSYPTAIKFWYDNSPSMQKVRADIYEFDKTTKTVGSYVGEATDASFIKTRLVNILDQSIIVKDFVDKNGDYCDGFYLTKDGNVIKVTGLEGIGEDVITSYNTKFQGGGDLIESTPTNEQVVHPRDSGIYHQENGTTFLSDTLVQTPLRSVFSILNDAANYPEFQKFFDLLYGFTKNEVFIKATNYFGIDDFNIKFFNSFRYTVYVPDNGAMDDAYAQGLIKTWTYIENMPTTTPAEVALRDEEVSKLERFVRYHFQDNSVFISPNQSFTGKFQTATIKTTDPETDPTYLGTAQNKFYRIEVADSLLAGGQKTVSLTCEINGAKPYTVNVDVSDEKYYNIMTRDYVFNRNPVTITSRTDENYLKSQITTSSTAVIHRIGKVLRFE